jgi:glycosyltransferase involved in cell wall biosynthesis
LGQLFRRVDQFLCIGTANRELYRSYSVPESKLHMAMYAVDNERFAAQANALRGQRSEIRGQWKIPQDAFCILFCGKFIPKKHPMDLIKAVQLLLSQRTKSEAPSMQLLFAGSGELGAELRSACRVVFDAEQPQTTDNGLQTTGLDNLQPITDNAKPAATFTGFLNQTEVSRAYVAADCLVLPSDYDETWGLVVNEAMACGLPCIISDRCGCAPDLGNAGDNSVFSFGNISDLAKEIVDLANRHGNRSRALEPPSFPNVVDLVAILYG